MIKINKNSSIYVLCPASYATGGTELLHQFVDLLIELKFNAKIYYLPNDIKNPTPERFKKYKINSTHNIDDNKSNIIIIPEVSTQFVNKFKYIRKIIWWLSVDNYYVSQSGIRKKIKKFLGLYKPYNFNDFSVYHLVQSYYAYDFLKSKQIRNIEFLSDYVNADYINNDISYLAKDRNDICFYNPKKGYEFTKLIIDKSKDNIKWIALENMNVNEIKELLRRGKVYIDFGNHPGKDRFPREAAISGCCVITGKRGAAKFYQDIPINDKYKFYDDVNNVDKIVNTIEICLNNYDNEIKNFQDYRNMIVNEKDKFKKDLLSIFKRA
ncbi:glycosyltransferase [Clostridium tyrobutyricum]|uniref:glycosyltransferase n=1 Tax=Clostridium tyrobutyricum TaxID=1519 RepID=UPI00073D9A89|nr:glycosyltransferase [Clostridium tyrobutyricum]